MRTSTHSNCHISFAHYLGILPIADLYVASCNEAVNTACLPTEKNTGSPAFRTFTARVLLCARVCTWSILQSHAAVICACLYIEHSAFTDCSYLRVSVHGAFCIHRLQLSARVCTWNILHSQTAVICACLYIEHSAFTDCSYQRVSVHRAFCIHRLQLSARVCT